MGGEIAQVLPDSIAEELGIEPGDILHAINNIPVIDLIDYNYYQDSDYLELTIEKANNHDTWICEVEKFPEEEIGLVFTANVFDKIRSCENHCLFCFIDQLQPKPRASLLLKDDDYRMSFMEGSFITCTNLTEADYQRIAKLRLSPLYVSVHTIDPLLRQKMLGRKKSAEIMLSLQRLIAIGCELHTQIVLCPGINDGAALAQTLDALAQLAINRKKLSLAGAGGIASVAIVPVGLSKYQKNPLLRLFTQEEAAAIIDDIELRQAKYLDQIGSRLIYASDEMYLLAERDFPPGQNYEGFPQIENGVGLAALFYEQWQEMRNNIPKEKITIPTAVITGKSGEKLLAPIIAEINKESGNQIELIAIENFFYGSTVTASGLVTASCIRKALPKKAYQRIIIPSSMLKFDQDIFLDDLSVADLSAALDCAVQIAEPDPISLIKALFQDPPQPVLLRK